MYDLRVVVIGQRWSHSEALSLLYYCIVHCTWARDLVIS